MSNFAGTWTVFKIRSLGNASPIENGTPISFTDDSGGKPTEFKFTPTGSKELPLSIPDSGSTADTINIDRKDPQRYRVFCQILSAGKLSLMLGLVSDGTTRGGVGDSNTDSFVAVKTSG